MQTLVARRVLTDPGDVLYVIKPTFFTTLDLLIPHCRALFEKTNKWQHALRLVTLIEQAPAMTVLVRCIQPWLYFFSAILILAASNLNTEPMRPGWP